ncbi:Transcription factor bHLH94 [Hibiscus syriacus]|uniref:Transcription factor bHLH94 n=1 Tax=Hibiscus syriacus TaxID=106335 RepID=A0A6A3BK21_HIBSY|nr:Transcription factor bHLH94 [Hibiscus syriacus]
MALEAVVYPPDRLTYGFKDQFPGGGAWGNDFCFQEEDGALTAILESNLEQQENHHHLHANWDSSSTSVMQQHSLPAPAAAGFQAPTEPHSATTTATNGSRRKRRRTRSNKNKEELENQRMTHIAVERNRRKQMNEYLAAIRALMPPSYVQRGDQASIIGGAINFVKEIEQLLQTMEAHKRTSQQTEHNGNLSPFAEFFTFPQFSTRATSQCNNSPSSMPADQSVTAAASVESVADIEVTMVETHANLKIQSKKRPRQLLKLVAGLQSLSLTILHLNVSTVDETALYSISVKVDEGCHLNTVDEIAAAINYGLKCYTLNIKWVVGFPESIERKCGLLEDVWLSDLGPLKDFIADQSERNSLPNRYVASMVDSDGHWRWPLFIASMPNHILLRLAATMPPLQQSKEDVPGWKWRDHCFSVKSTYDMSDRLLINAERVHRHMCTNSCCGVCRQTGETVDHLFQLWGVHEGLTHGWNFVERQVMLEVDNLEGSHVIFHGAAHEEFKGLSTQRPNGQQHFPVEIPGTEPSQGIRSSAQPMMPRITEQPVEGGTEKQPVATRSPDSYPGLKDASKGDTFPFFRRRRAAATAGHWWPARRNIIDGRATAEALERIISLSLLLSPFFIK